MKDLLSLKSIVVLALVFGSGLLLLMLGSGTIPEANRDFFNIALGSWFSWSAMAVKRILDGSDSSDAKTAALVQLAGAGAPPPAAPGSGEPAEPAP